MANITLKDVAARAGVSISLASKVLTGKMGNSTVSDEKAEKIMSAAREMGYVANNSARRLRMGRGKTIAVLLPFGREYFNTVFYSFMDGILDVAKDSQYEFYVVFYQWNSKELESLHRVLNMPIDGFIYYPSYEAEGSKKCKEAVESIVRAGVPTIVSGISFPRIEGCRYYDLEEQSAGYIITKYCIEKGKKRILLLTSYDENRNAGYMQAMKEAGLPIFTTGEIAFTRSAGYVFFMNEYKKWGGDPPEAIFATCDLCALGVLDAMHETGYTQDDITVVAVDGLQTVESICPEKFPTVRQPTFEMGRQAAHGMIEFIETGDTKSKVFYQTEIING